MINVIGLGYIGLPTALMFACCGIKVVGTDHNKELVAMLNNGKTTFSEFGIEDLFNKAIKNGIKFTTNYQKAEIYIISVPTPYDESSKKIDISYIENAIDEVLKHCEYGAIIVIESTVSPGTINKRIRPFIEKNGFEVGKDIYLVHSPERIMPGKIVSELTHNNRTIGSDNYEIGEKVKNLYASFCQGEIEVTDIKTAEMTKVVENTFRDINIAFANELTKICHRDNMDVYEIIRLANKHPRVNILSPGPGVGGHCISVDPWFLVGDYPGLANIIFAARKINDSMPEFVLSRVHEIMNERNMNDVRQVGFYGITYKEDVDDVRESPTLQMFNIMKRHLSGDRVYFYDPYVKKDILPNQKHALDDFLNSINLIVIMVGHSEIKENVNKLKGKIILDTRYICHLDGVYRL